MRHILSPAQLPLLRRFSWSRVLLAFDFDGTLSPIVRDPAEARLRRRTRTLLGRLARLYPCAVISGRSRPDVVHRLAAIPLQAVSGNHGLEPSHAYERYERLVRSWSVTLRPRLARVQGVVLEDKRYSLAIHYRLARRPREAMARIRDAIAPLSRVRVIGGKTVLNLIPEGAPHKGTALEAIRAQLGCDTAIYVGDDDTDEDVFLMAAHQFFLGVRVGRNRRSLAGYYLENQREVDALLEVLLSFRGQATARGAGSPCAASSR